MDGDAAGPVRDAARLARDAAELARDGAGPVRDAAGPNSDLPGLARQSAGLARDGTRPRDGTPSVAGWELLARSARRQEPHLSAPPPGGHGLCAACRIPVRPANVYCYQCRQHAETLPGLLADVVVPICYAAKGGAHARNLWLYKSARPGAGCAQAALRALLIVFLRDHGPCVWRSAGITGPSHLAVVPSGRGRAGPHPLRLLAGSCLARPWVSLGLRLRDEPGTRDLDADRFSAPPVPGADVALLDDTWTTGASAQSACAALRLAGARSVTVIVLGRHVAANARPAADTAFRPWLCAVHVPPGDNGQ